MLGKAQRASRHRFEKSQLFSKACHPFGGHQMCKTLRNATVGTVNNRLHLYVDQVRARSLAFLKSFGEITTVFVGHHGGQPKPRILNTPQINEVRIKRIANHESHSRFDP